MTGDDVATEALEKVSVKAKKTNLTVKLVSWCGRNIEEGVTTEDTEDARNKPGRVSDLT